LKRAGLAFDRLLQLAREVQPGDPENREATAARIYWQRLYGRDFRRRGDDPRVSALNWGYAVLRAMVSRSLVASGLHPAIGLKHMAPNNPFNLADDLMEPFRPLVDAAVRTIEPEAGDPSLWKSALSEIGERPVLLPEGVFRLRSAITRMASSFAQVIDAGQGKILLPQAFPGEEDAGRLESDVVDGPLCPAGCGEGGASAGHAGPQAAARSGPHGAALLRFPPLLWPLGKGAGTRSAHEA